VRAARQAVAAEVECARRADPRMHDGSIGSQRTSGSHASQAIYMAPRDAPARKATRSAASRAAAGGIARIEPRGRSLGSIPATVPPREEKERSPEPVCEARGGSGRDTQSTGRHQGLDPATGEGTIVGASGE